MIGLLALAGGSAALLGAAWFVHTRLRGFLPEDPPAAGRKRHPRPTAMAGSLPAAITALVLAYQDLRWLAGAVALAALTGLADDLIKGRGEPRGLRWTTKAAGLAAAAACAAVDVAGGDPAIFALSGGLIFVLTNATNFLDNQDGVAVTLGGIALALVGRCDPAATASLLAGVWLAFLPFNWPRARMFLGDSGAFALGIAAASLSCRAALGPAGFDPVAAIAPMAVIALDFVQVVGARLVLGYAPWIGDRRHLTHVLLARGLPRVALAPLLGGVALAIGLIAR